MATKKTEADLAALFKLEFYRKKSNWKFCSQVHGKTKKEETKVMSKPCAAPTLDKPEDKCLNKTYNAEPAEKGERSVIDEGFMDTDNDKNISTPQNSPISPDKNKSPEFNKTFDKWSPLAQLDGVPNQNTSQEKPNDTNPEQESLKHDINLPNQNWAQNQEYRIVDQYCLEDKKMQNWAYQTKDNLLLEMNKRQENDQITHQEYNDPNLLQQAVTKYRQDYMIDKTNHGYQQNDIIWPENAKECPQQEVNNNNPKSYTDLTLIEKLPEPIFQNWQTWKDISQNTLNISQYSSDKTQNSVNMPPISPNAQISPNMPQTPIIPKISPNMPQISSNMPQILPNIPQKLPNTPQNWVENIWPNNMVWQECQGSNLLDMDKEGYKGTEAGGPLETKIWTNNKPEAISWSDDVLREWELHNAQELDPEIPVPVAGEKWVSPEGLLQWMLANRECCDNVLEPSLESEEQFMRGAHSAPHSTVFDLQPQLDAIDTSAEAEAVCALTESELHAVDRARRFLQRMREKQQRSRSSSHLPPSPQYDINCEEYPTRHQPTLHQPTFISYKNNPNYKNLNKRIDKEEVPKRSVEGPRIIVDRGQIRVIHSSGLERQSGVHGNQFGLVRGQTGLDYGLEKGRSGLNYGQGETGQNYRQNIQKGGQTGLDWGQIVQTDLNRGQIGLKYDRMGFKEDQKGLDFSPRVQMDLEIGQKDIIPGQIGLDKCQIGLPCGQPNSFEDHYLIGRGRGRLPIKVKKGRGQI